MVLDKIPTFEEVKNYVDNQSRGPKSYDQAETFDESDLTLSLSDLSVNQSNSLALSSGFTELGGVPISSNDKILFYFVYNDTGDEYFIQEDRDTYDIKLHNLTTDTITNLGQNVRNPFFVVDIDDDGKDELVFSDKDPYGLAIYHIDTDTFEWTENNPISTTRFAVGDFDNDGVPEVGWHDGSPDETYIWDYIDDTNELVKSGEYSNGLFPIDIDNDGVVELITLDGSDAFAFYDYIDDSYTQVNQSEITDTAGHKFFADIDGDGVKEMVFSHEGTSGTSNRIASYDHQDGTVIEYSAVGTPELVGNFQSETEASLIYDRESDGNIGLLQFSTDETTVTNITHRPSIKYPSSSSNLETIIIPIFDSDTSTYSNKRYGTANSTSGSATLEWPHPDPLYQWNVVTFSSSPDGETVDLFVEYSEDDGSTWNRTNGGNPVDRNYSLQSDTNIDKTTWVRYVVEISKSNEANNPTLDRAYRSWFL